MSAGRPPPTPGRAWLVLSRWWGPVAILAVGLAMLCWTWGTWPDVLVDFGPQLYVPWQLAHGKVLYRDIDHYNGPLSQYVGAAVFRVFGTGLWMLIACNLLILTGLSVLLYWMLSQVASRWSAAVACICFMLLFAFAQFTPIGNYNYVCPYAHEMTHGVALSLLALALIWQYPSWGLWSFAAGGLALGLAFLTKAEVFVGGAAGLAAALILILWYERPPAKRKAGMVVVLLGGFLLPPLVAFSLLALAMPASKAFSGTIGSWAVAAVPRVTELHFFRHTMGVDDIAGNIHAMLQASGWYAVALVPPALAALAVRRYRLHPGLVAGILFAAAALILAGLRQQVVWPSLARPFPLILLLAGTGLGIGLWRRERDDPQQLRRLVRQMSLLVLALAMLAKLALHVRLSHYGFVLAMPAAMVIFVALLDWMPAVIEKFGGAGIVFAAAIVGLLGPVAAAHVMRQQLLVAAKKYRVGKGVDGFWADERGPYVKAALDVLASRFPADATLAALPEGIMINYLGRRINPTPYTNCMPTETMFFGEDKILASLQAHPPDLVFIVHKDTTEFGYQFFGRDYAIGIGEWLKSAYEPAGLIGAPPLQNAQFGIAVLRRKDAAVQGNPSGHR